MSRRDDAPTGAESALAESHWLRFGVAASVGWAALAAAVLLAMQVDPALGLGVAVAGSLLGALAVVLLVRVERDGELLVERVFGR